MAAGLLFGLSSLVGLAFAASNYALAAVKGEPFPVWNAIYWSLLEWWLWALLTPLIMALASRYPFSRGDWPRALSIHAVLWLGVHLLHEALFVAVDRSVGSLYPAVMYAAPERTVAQSLLLYGGKRAAFNLMVYAGVVGAAHALDIYRRYRERELTTSQLETRLARAQLDLLRSQLQPHFLFNTLNTISALLRSDPDAAERVITRLGDLLRLSMQNAGRQEVALRQEIEFLERYLEIQQTRFRDRLSIRLEADPEALDALVPTLVLQPLVENAIKHGIEPRATSGRVEILARRADDTLTLRVTDDGPGLSASPPDHPFRVRSGNGIGLANTRARLRQLYGAAHRFDLSNAPGGGLVVTLEIPYRVGDLPTPVAGLHD